MDRLKTRMLLIRQPVVEAVERLAKEEDRSYNNMGNVLLKEVLVQRGVRLDDFLDEVNADSQNRTE